MGANEKLDMRIKAFMKFSNAPSTLTFVEHKAENVGHYSATAGQPHLPKMYKNNNKTSQKLRNCPKGRGKKTGEKRSCNKAPAGSLLRGFPCSSQLNGQDFLVASVCCETSINSSIWETNENKRTSSVYVRVSSQSHI